MDCRLPRPRHTWVCLVRPAQMTYRLARRISAERVEMACRQRIIHLAIAIAACVGAPEALLAAQDQYQSPGYTAPAPAPDDLGNDTVLPMIVTPDPDPPAVPDVTFFERLQKLNNVAPVINAQPGPITSDTTSSYSTSILPGSTTRDTTSSYTTSISPGSTTRDTTSSYSTIPNSAR
jgi:hypothetical protein